MMVQKRFVIGPYSFTRAETHPAEVEGEVVVRVEAELRSDESLLYLDCVIGLLQGAVQYLKFELPNNPSGSERKAQIANILSRVRDIQREIEGMPI